MAIKHFTPQTVQQWIATVGMVGTMLAAGVTGTYATLLKVGLIGGKLEKVNLILADEHVGETPVSEITVLDEPDDLQKVYNFSNGDTLYYRKYEDNAGKRQKLKRWTSKRSLDEIIQSAWLEDWIHWFEPKTAYAVEKNVYYAFLPDEVYIGKTEDGHSIYFIMSEAVCEKIDEATGEILEVMEPPCNQYVIKEQKKGKK